MDAVRAKGDLIDGRWLLPAVATGELEVRSPADLDDLVGRFPTNTPHVALAVEAARRAQPMWEATPLAERIARMRAFGEALKAREALLVQLIGREVGKPAWEAKTEVGALLSKIEITVNEALPLVQGFSLDGGKLQTRYRPHGVLAVIGPFNFPLHLAHGHIVPALLTGNTVVFKPSESAPATAQLYAEAAEAAGLPPGVFNLVQGRGPEGAALSSHPDIDGLLFTGSYETGCKIIEANAHRPGRMLALELGGKNSALVLADAPFEKTLYDVLYSALVTAGQRCTALSRVIVERPLADRFVTALVERAGSFRVGPPTDPGTFMGPLATRLGFEKFERAQAQAKSEGAETLRASERPELPVRGYYVTPSIHLVSKADPASPYQAAEIFGPDLAVYVADDLEQACALADATPYGLAMGVYTAREEAFEACFARVRTGCLAWNMPTVGSSSRLPFGGVKHSGNHRPAALFSTLYCTYPVAVSRGGEVLDSGKLPPGVRWD